MKSSKSNINFDYIEFEISEKDLEIFKNNIAQGCIRRVDQISGNKWHYLIKADESLLEVEVSYNKNNLKQFHCACGANSPGKICKHVQLICYWHVNTIRSKSDTYSALSRSIPIDLSHSAEDDLRYYLIFLSKQSKLNKEWVYFFDAARSIQPDSFQKYNLLIERFNQFITGQTRNSVSKIKFILQLYEELYFISFYHYKQSNVEEAILALLAGISKLHDWHSSLDWKTQSRLQLINEKLHSALEQFLILIVAPRALNKLFKVVSETMVKKEYLILNNKSNLFHILNLRFNKTNHSKQYFNSLIEKLNLNIREECKFQILDYLYSDYPVQLKDYLITIEINNSVYWVLSWLDSRKSKITTEYLFELYSKIYEVTTLELKAFVALKIADLYSRHQELVSGHLLIKYYLETGLTRILELYFKDQEFSNHAFELFLGNLEKSVLTKSLTLNQKLELAYYSNQWLLLINLLSQAEDFENIIKYDSKFPEEYHPKLIEIYIKYTKNYLESHVGQKSHQKVDSIIRHIKSIYRSKIYNIFINEVKQLFPNRKLISQN